ncbi:MAG: SCO family protein [Chloroflexota bacterium]
MKNAISILSGILALVLIAAAGFYFLRPHTFHGTVLQSSETAHDFTLHVASGKTVHLSDFRGKIVLIYFGYTFCPDVCPATLGNVNHALGELGKRADEVQVIMVSVDPQRDTPEKLAQYVGHFNKTFIGGTNTPEEIAKIAALYGVFYEVSQETTSHGDYLIDHTATLMVIDKEGYLKLVFPFGVTGDEIADDLKYMLR